jgi:hypothetical protein
MALLSDRAALRLSVCPRSRLARGLTARSGPGTRSSPQSATWPMTARRRARSIGAGQPRTDLRNDRRCKTPLQDRAHVRSYLGRSWLEHDREKRARAEHDPPSRGRGEFSGAQDTRPITIREPGKAAHEYSFINLPAGSPAMARPVMTAKGKLGARGRGRCFRVGLVTPDAVQALRPEISSNGDCLGLWTGDEQ